MLEGVRSGPIIAGAYTSPQGTCPMLAAHRRGGRTSLDTFARAWDGYTRAQTARLATERELRTLESMLLSGLGEDEAPASELERAITEHREARARAAVEPTEEVASNRPQYESRRVAPGDPDRSAELRRRPGWAWLRVFRRIDDYEAALAQVRADEAAAPSAPPVGAGSRN